ncbi:hypothetical protein ACP275_08G222900 [Erythranthe tilingii]
MRALIITYLLLLVMHIDPTVSTANNKNPRFDRMLKGKQPSPPPPRSATLISPKVPSFPSAPPPCPPPTHLLHFPPLHFMNRRPPPPPPY